MIPASPKAEARRRSGSPGLTAALVAAALTAFAVAHAPAMAQVQLIPGESGVEQPETSAPAQTEPPARTAPEGMSVETLESVDSEAVGAALDPAAALPSDLWSGLSRPAVVALIDGLGSAGRLPGARDLTRRLLLSAAALPPEGADTGVSVLRARVEALARLGFAEDAARLAQAGAGALTDPAGRRATARAQLAAFDLPGACRTASEAGLRDVFWEKLLAFCRAVAGQRDAAALAAQTLMDQGIEDPLYFTLMESLTLDLAPEVGGLTAEGPLHYAMLRQAGAPVPDRVADPGAARLAVERGGDLGAAEEAAGLGILPPGDLAALYEGEAFKASALDAPLEVLDRVSAPAARALLYQVLQRWDLPSLKAEAISVALRRAQADGVLIGTAPVFAGPARDIPPETDLLWFAEDAARLFYLTGDLALAQRWHRLLRDAAGGDAEAARAKARLYPLALLSGAEAPEGDDWQAAAITGAPDPAAVDRWVALTAVLSDAALGRSPDPDDAGARAMALSAGAESGPGPGAALVQLMDDAAVAGRLGETVVLAVAALAAAPPEEARVGGLASAIGALRRVGLAEDARRLAREIAVLRAPPPAER
jgi:hypothetical protein